MTSIPPPGQDRSQRETLTRSSEAQRNSTVRRLHWTAAGLAVLALAAGGLSLLRGEDGGPPQRSAASMLAYGAAADHVCALNYQRGNIGETRVEQIAKRHHWPAPKTEAEIRYAWADALQAQYRMLAALGPPPREAALMRRWRETSRLRSTLYRRGGDAWAVSDKHRAGVLWSKLALAKEKADQLAQRLPFHACGTPLGSFGVHPGRRQLVRHPAVIYSAKLPLTQRDLVRKGLGVYWYHHVAGRVVDVVPGATSLLIDMRLKRRYARRMIGASLRLFRSHEHPSISWLAIIPHR
jgi:hypothetical protein